MFVKFCEKHFYLYMSGFFGTIIFSLLLDAFLK